MIFKESKYTKAYYKIIEKRKENPAIEGEIHHIIPKSLGGSDNKDNLVKLTYREHYLCHLLLTKMCESINKIKMCWALHMLTFSKTSYSSHQYETARKIHIKNLKENHPSKNKEWVDIVSKTVYDNWKDNTERRKKTSDIMKKRWEERRSELTEHNKKISILGNLAYKEKNKHKLEYKGEYFHSWSSLLEKTGITKHLYNKYYKNGIDPEFRIGACGPHKK